MHTKLNLKIYGATDAADRELLKNNLRSQDGITSLRLLPFKGFTAVKMDIDSHKISKQQVFDVIKFGGDFKIEEQGEIEDEISAESSRINDQTTFPLSINPAKASFMLGLLSGLAVVSLLGNIILGYILFKPDSGKDSGSRNSAATDIWAPTPTPSPSPQVQGAAAPIQNFAITEDDHVRGDFKAPITLVEYSDFECPFCERHYPTLKKILSDYQGQVRLVYKHFPLGFHPNAQKAAEASECAADQGKFWEYHDKLFDNQPQGYSLDKFKQWAKDLKLDAAEFNDCLDSGKYAGKVQADEVDGQTRGVQGTPATFVNGQLVSGAVPYESFQSVIDQILK